jgi:hypothetical protein
MSCRNPSGSYSRKYPAQSNCWPFSVCYDWLHNLVKKSRECATWPFFRTREITDRYSPVCTRICRKLQNFPVDCVAPLPRIRRVSVSNLGPETGNDNWGFLLFTQFLHGHAKILQYIKLRVCHGRFPFTFSLIYRHAVEYLVEAIY